MGQYRRRHVLATVAGAGLSALLSGCGGPDGAGRSPTGPTSTGTTREPPTGSSTTSPTTQPTETAVPEPPSACPSCDPSYLRVPPGFTVTRFADSEALGGGEWRPGPEPGPRLLGTHEGRLFATIPSQGRVVAFEPTGDGTRAASVETVVADLDRPHGIAFDGDRLYLALEHDVRRYRLDGTAAEPDSMEVLVDDIPSGRNHWTRTIVVHDGRLYLSAGACQPPGSAVCEDGRTALLGAIHAFDLDGRNPVRYATGLRNAVGLTWHDGRLIATDNGVDGLGPEVPADEVNVVEQGGHYGYPECYGHNTPNAEVGATATDCENRIPPRVTLPAHSAPLGCEVYTAERYPRAYRGDLYVALHGSWARPNPVGYKVVRIPIRDGEFGSVHDFLTGWMPDGGANADARGRPVDVHVGRDGVLYVSDDMAGVILRVDYVGG